MKLFLLLFLFATLLVAKSFYFHEQRYSAALEKTLDFEGVISFGVNSLKIKYKNTDKTIIFKNEEVDILQGSKRLKLSEEQSLQMALFFETLLDIYHQRDVKLAKNFHIQQHIRVVFFIPFGDIQEYIKKIELYKDLKRVTSIKFFLQNNDTIKIKIEHEIQ